MVLFHLVTNTQIYHNVILRSHQPGAQEGSLEMPCVARPVLCQQYGRRAGATPPGLGLLQEQRDKDRYLANQNFLL